MKSARRLQQLADNGIRQIQEEPEPENRQAELFGLNVPKQSWKLETVAAESFWLSPVAIQACARIHLGKRLGEASGHVLGEKPHKTLPINQASLATLLAARVVELGTILGTLRGTLPKAMHQPLISLSGWGGRIPR
jgi:hypothetical protein